MKKLIVSFCLALSGLLWSCASEDHKNEAAPYPGYDTTGKMEQINGSHADSTGASTQNGAGDMKNDLNKGEQ